MIRTLTRLCALLALLTFVPYSAATAQPRGHIDRAHTHAFSPAPGRQIQTHINVKGWLHEDAWPRQCTQHEYFKKPLIVFVVRAPNRAPQYIWEYNMNNPFRYRPDVFNQGLACNVWSGFEHTIVLNGVYLYPNVHISALAWNTSANNWVWLGGARHTTYSNS